MALIKTVAPESKEQSVADVYNFWEDIQGQVPKPFELMSASPDLLRLQLQIAQHYLKHPSLEFPVLSLINYLAAKSSGHEFCIQHNAKFLKMQGMDEAAIEAVEQDPAAAPVSDKERAMVAFAIKAVNSPESIESADVDELREHGWSDQAIFDAVYQGTIMVGNSILMKAFKMEIA